MRRGGNAEEMLKRANRVATTEDGRRGGLVVVEGSIRTGGQKHFCLVQLQARRPLRVGRLPDDLGQHPGPHEDAGLLRARHRHSRGQVDRAKDGRRFRKKGARSLFSSQWLQRRRRTLRAANASEGRARFCAGTKMGQGPHAKVCRVAAQAFGIALDDVCVDDSGTDKAAITLPSAMRVSADF